MSPLATPGGGATDARQVQYTPTGGVRRTVATDLNEQIVNVRRYGAVADDSTDNNAFIVAAIDALPASGGIIYFPPGTYRVVGSLPINRKSNITFRGAGRWVSTIKTVSAGTALWQAVGTTVAQNVAWEHLGIETGGADAMMLSGSVLRGRTRVTACRFGPTTYGITGIGIADLLVEDSVFYTFGTGQYTGVQCHSGCKRVTVRENDFRFLSESIVFNAIGGGGGGGPVRSAGGGVTTGAVVTGFGGGGTNFG